MCASSGQVQSVTSSGSRASMSAGVQAPSRTADRLGRHDGASSVSPAITNSTPRIP